MDACGIGRDDPNIPNDPNDVESPDDTKDELLMMR